MIVTTQKAQPANLRDVTPKLTIAERLIRVVFPCCGDQVASNLARKSVEREGMANEEESMEIDGEGSKGPATSTSADPKKQEKSRSTYELPWYVLFLVASPNAFRE